MVESVVRVLGIDTSSNTGSVALVVAGDTPWSAEVVATASARVSNAHGESLLPLVEGVLRAAGVTLESVELIAVGIGPGSFTGTRIGVATAKGLALGADKPLRGVTSFESLVADAGMLLPGAFQNGEEVAVAIDARKGEVYVSVVSISEDDVTTIVEPVHAPPLVAWARMGRAVPPRAVGDGARMVPELAAFCRVRIGLVAPTAAAIAAIAGSRQRRAPLDEGDVLEPLYVRPPDITLPNRTPGLPRTR